MVCGCINEDKECQCEDWCKCDEDCGCIECDFWFKDGVECECGNSLCGCIEEDN